MKKNHIINHTETFAATLVRWFESAMRPLPWRKTYDPYGVWISEIMLQQTQADRGANYYARWMRRFPDLRSVADAGEEEVLALWEGLGYYSRARNLHAAARSIMRDHGGEFPRDIGEIRALPGIGDYTAGAIASIAFNQPEPAIDANVLRIFARLCDIDAPPTGKETRSEIAGLIRTLIHDSPPRMFCQGLMELGALICGKKPKCDSCPLSHFCEARKAGTVALRPVPSSTAPYQSFETATGIILCDNRIFIRQRPPRGLWAGLWEFPGGRLLPGDVPEEAVAREAARAANLPVVVREKIGVVRHGYTNNRVIMHGYLCGIDGEGSIPPPRPDAIWVTREEISGYAFPAGHRKLLERLGWKK